MVHPNVPGGNPDAPSADRFYFGPPEFHQAQTAAILNSRQSKYPLGNDSWIKASTTAVEYAVEHGLTVFTSLGMNTYELVLAQVAELHGRVIVVVPPTRDEPEVTYRRVIDEYRLDAQQTAIIIFRGLSGSKKSWPVERDQFIAEKADFLFPVSVRPHGNWERILNRWPEKVDERFAVAYESKVRPRPRYDHLPINPAILSGEYIIHFTRSRSSSWPDQTPFDFYSRVTESGAEYSHSARNGLINILSSGKIIASRRGIRGGHRVVGFSAVDAGNISHLLQYRSRLINPYFEPYGIALPKARAAEFGIKPVIYGSPEDFVEMNEIDRPFFQNAGKLKERWRTEKEWRHVGDFRLSMVSAELIIIVVGFSADVGIVKQYTNEPVLIFFG